MYQRYWTDAVPMEVELDRGGHAVPGLAAADHAGAALDLRESACFSTDTGTSDTPHERIRASATPYDGLTGQMDLRQ